MHTHLAFLALLLSHFAIGQNPSLISHHPDAPFSEEDEKDAEGGGQDNAFYSPHTFDCQHSRTMGGRIVSEQAGDTMNEGHLIGLENIYPAIELIGNNPLINTKFTRPVNKISKPRHTVCLLSLLPSPYPPRQWLGMK